MRPTRRHALSGAAAIASAGVLGAACGPVGQDSAAGAVSLDPKRRYAVTYWHWGDQVYNEREKRTLARFRDRFPNIDVDVALVAEAFEEKAAAAFAAGTAPDVHHVDMQVVQAWGAKNVLLDLKPYLKRDKDLSLGFYEKSPISKQALDIMSSKGQVIGLPGEAAPNLVFYNADLFRNAGLKTPTELWKEDKWTWEAFVEATTRLTQRNADAWQIAGASEGRHRLWMNAAGGREFDDVKSPKRCLYDEAGSIEGLSFLQDLRHKHRVVPVDFRAAMGAADTNTFIAGRLVMLGYWTVRIGRFKDIKDFKWGMVPYPKRKTYATDFATSGPGIAKESKSQEAAWEWAKFREGPEGSVPHAEDGISVFFQPEARKVVQEKHKSIATLETP